MKTRLTLLVLALAASVSAAQPQTAPAAPAQAAPAPSSLAAQQAELAALNKRINQQDIYPTMKMAQEKVKLDPSDAKAHRTLAEHLGAEHGQFQNEMRERREAMRSNPDNPYDIIALASMERFVHRAETLSLLGNVINGTFDAPAKECAKQVLASVKLNPKPLRAR